MVSVLHLARYAKHMRANRKNKGLLNDVFNKPATGDSRKANKSKGKDVPVLMIIGASNGLCGVSAMLLSFRVY